MCTEAALILFTRHDPVHETAPRCIKVDNSCETFQAALENARLYRSAYITDQWQTSRLGRKGLQICDQRSSLRRSRGRGKGRVGSRFRFVLAEVG